MGNTSAVQAAEQILKTYNLKIIDQQHIALAGRVIIAFYISFDPAHAKAITDELTLEMAKNQLDVALELLPE